jgi:hypothetical protein
MQKKQLFVNKATEATLHELHRVSSPLSTRANPAETMLNIQLAQICCNANQAKKADSNIKQNFHKQYLFSELMYGLRIHFLLILFREQVHKPLNKASTHYETSDTCTA